MPTSYTSLLGMALPVTGELSGTWGDTVNDYITKYVDAAVAGVQTISGSQTAVTLSTTQGGVLTSAGTGSTGSAQYAIINCTGNPASLLTITAPATSKAYIVINATSTSQSVKIVGAGPTTGVTVASGDKALIAWNGSDFVRVGASAGGSNTQIQYNSSGNLAGSSSLTFSGSQFTSTVQSSFGGAVGAESLRATPVASAVNYVNVQGATTGNAPSISATGSNTNVGLTFSVKGQAPVTFTSSDASVASYGIELGDGNSGSRQTYIDFHSSPSTDYDLRIVRNVGANNSAQYINAGAEGHYFSSLGGTQFVVAHTASTVNYVQATGAATGVAPAVSAQGSNTNIDLQLSAKGTGAIRIGTLTGLLKGTSGAVSAAVAGTDYAAATTGTNAQLLANNGSGGFSNVTVGSGLTYSAGTLSAASTTSIGLVRAVAINCILP